MKEVGKFFTSLAPLGRKILAALVIIIIILAVVTIRSCQSAGVAKREAKLHTSQTGAALASGADAVGTVGAVGDRAAQADALTKENDHAIRQAQGADAPVADPARAAGMLALCKRAAYRRDPKCVQFTPAP